MKPYAELAYLGQIRLLRNLAKKALVEFGLPNVRLTFIIRSENTTFRVDTADQNEAKSPGD